MSKKQPQQLPYQRRIKSILRTLRAEGRASAAIISSAPEVIKSFDQYFPYHQDSDFFYLTGSNEPNLSLFISGKYNAVTLVAKKVSVDKKLWDGEGESAKTRAALIGAELIESENPYETLKTLLRSHEGFFHHARPHTVSDQLFRFCSGLTPRESGNMYPTAFRTIESLTHPLRLIKDRYEIDALQHAAHVTMQSIVGAIDTIQPGSTERIIAKTLHYTKNISSLKKGDALLLDCGAECNGYNGDITRTFPVGGTFNGAGADLYDIVLAAQKNAITKIKPQVKVNDVFLSAAKILVEGLKNLNLLKGSTESLIAQKKYKTFFPHGIGHSLGIDVHDVGGHRENKAAVLHEGMVFTVEPGLYIPNRIGTVAPIGIRIEDDVLVTKNGCKVLTALLPKERKDLEGICKG